MAAHENEIRRQHLEQKPRMLKLLFAPIGGLTRNRTQLPFARRTRAGR
jgi:hypothetical protein